MEACIDTVDTAFRTTAEADDDAELLRRFCECDDREALGALFQRHCDAAYRTALRMCGNSADAEDAVQNAFVQVMRKAAQHEATSSVRGWMMSIVVNEAKMRIRAEARRRKHEDAVVAREDSADLELQAQVLAKVQQLPANYREPLSLYYFEGFTSKEVAAALQIPENTVRSQLQRGLEKLRVALGGASASLSVVSLEQALSTVPQAAAPAAVATTLQSIAAGSVPLTACGAAGTAKTIWIKVTAAALVAALAAVVLPAVFSKPSQTAAILPVTGPDETAGDQNVVPKAADEIDAKLAGILATRFDANYKRNYLGELLYDLAQRFDLRTAYPPALEQSVTVGIEAKQISVKEVLERAAAAGGLDLKYHKHTVVFWKKAADAHLQALKKKLSTGDVQQRCEAAHDLSLLADPRIYPLLFNALGDKDAAVRDWVRGLDVSKGAGLCAHLQVFGFAEGTEVAARHLMAHAQADEDAMRSRILLGGTRRPEALEWLLKHPFIATGEIDDHYVNQIALSFFADAPVSAIMIKALDNGRTAVMESRLPQWVCSDEPKLAAAIVELKNKGRMKKTAKRRIGSTDPQTASRTVDDWIALLKSGDHMKAFEANFHLAQSRDARGLKALADVIRGADQMNAPSAANSLVHSGDPNAIDILKELARDKNAAVRSSVMGVLGHSADPSVVESVLAGLDDSDASVQKAALQSAPYIKDPRIAEILVAKAKANALQVEAVTALGMANDPRAVPVLLDLLKLGDPKLSEPIGQIIQRVRDSRLVEPLVRMSGSTAAKDREGAGKGLAYFSGNNDAQQALLKLLADPVQEVREQTAFHVSCQEALPAELAAKMLVLAKDPHERVRQHALRFIERNPSEEGFEIVAAAAKKKDLEGISAQRALQRFKVMPKYAQRAEAALAECKRTEEERNRTIPRQEPVPPKAEDAGDF